MYWTVSLENGILIVRCYEIISELHGSVAMIPARVIQFENNGDRYE